MCALTPAEPIIELAAAISLWTSCCYRTIWRLIPSRYYWNSGITSLANNSMDRITLACSMLPKDMQAPKYPMLCSSRNLVMR